MQLDTMMCNGILAVMNDLYRQFIYKYGCAEIDYTKVITALKNMNKDLVNGLYKNSTLPTEAQIDSTIIDLIKLAQAYESGGINFGGLGELGVGAAMAGINFDLATGKVTQVPNWLLESLLNNIDEVIRISLGNEAGNQIVDLVKSMELLENDLSLPQLQSIVLQMQVLQNQCPLITGYKTYDELISMLDELGLDDTLTISLQKITDRLFPIVNNKTTNYFDTAFLKKMEGMKLAYRIVRNMLLSAANRSPDSYWASQRVKEVNNFDITTP